MLEDSLAVRPLFDDVFSQLCIARAEDIVLPSEVLMLSFMLIDRVVSFVACLLGDVSPCDLGHHRMASASCVLYKIYFRVKYSIH